MRVEILSGSGLNALDDNKQKSHKRRVVGYARVSTDKDEQFTSYEAQITYYTNYIMSRDDWQFINIYTDEGISGTSTKKRIGFQRMIKDASKGKFDLIITKSISRFARNTLDSLEAIRKLKNKGVEIYFEKENIWTLDSKGELLITIMSSIAQEESRSISQNVTWGIRESMKQGKAYVPFKVFLGYDRGINGEMIINEKQAKIVKRIYAYAIQNRSPYSIAKILENEHVEFSPNVYKWYPSTIISILKNEKYKGDAIRQKTYTKDYLTKEKCFNNGEIPKYYIHNHHPAIISSDIFDRLQISLKEMKNLDHKRSRNYMFSRKIICADCGGYYGPVIWHPNTNSQKLVWRCNHKYKNHCLTPYISENRIKQIIIDSLNNYLSNQNKENIISTLFKAISKYIKNDRVLHSTKFYLKPLIDSPLIKSFNNEMYFSLIEKIIIKSPNEITICFNCQ